MSFKSGFIGIIGRPNAGKSTLLNAIMNQKIAITTNKPQTTRNTIRGIKTTNEYQMVFVDTPGIHKPKHELGKLMNRQAYSTISGVDVIYYIIDGTKPFGSGDRYLLKALENCEVPVFLLLNKLDLLKEPERIELLTFWEKQRHFDEIFPISALQHKNLEKLLEITLNYLHDETRYYPEGQVSDNPESFIISEIIREKVLTCTEQEVPHSVAVRIEKITYKNDTMIVYSMIYVERDSQKGIIIGKNGSMLKRISTMARKDIEFRFGCKVFLEIFVRVEKDWRNKSKQLTELGYMPEKE